MPCQAPYKYGGSSTGGGGAGLPYAGGIDLGQPGIYAPSTGPFGANNHSPTVASRVWLCRFIAPKSVSITKMAFGVGAAASTDDACDVGIYNAGITQLLGSSGSQSGLLNATGRKVGNLQAPVALVAGTVYYAAHGMGAPGGTLASLFCAQMQAVSLGMALFGTSAGLIELAYIPGGVPLPPGGGAPAASTYAPIFALLQ